MARLGEYIDEIVKVKVVMGEIYSLNDTHTTLLLYSGNHVVKAVILNNYLYRRIDFINEGVRSELLVIGRVLDGVTININYIVVLEKYPTIIVEPELVNHNIKGYIVGVRGIVSGHYRLDDLDMYYLSIDDSVVPVIVSHDLIIGNPWLRNNLSINNNVIVIGVVTEYYDLLVLKIIKPEWVLPGETGLPGDNQPLPKLPLPRGIYSNISLGNLSSIAPGSIIGLNVVLTGITYHDGYYILHVIDNTSYGYVYVDQETMNNIDPFMFGSNTLIYVYGTLDLEPEYGLVIYSSIIKLIEPSTPLEIDPCMISESMIGTPIILSDALVINSSIEEEQVILLVSIDNCTIKVIIPNNIYLKLPENIRREITTSNIYLTIVGFIDKIDSELIIRIYNISGVMIKT